MTTMTNYGAINYTVNDQTSNLTSNTVSTNLDVVYNAALLKGVSPAKFAPSTHLTYQIAVQNRGTGTLYNPVITDNLGSDTLPKPLSYVPGSVSAFLYDSNGTQVSAVDVTPAIVNGNLTFTTSTALPQGYYLVVTYNAAVNSSLGSTTALITNTATLSAAEGSPTGTPYTTSASATVTRETVTLTKAVSAASVTPGDPLTYTFTMTNIGSTPAAVNCLTDQLPANFTVTDPITAVIGSQSVTYHQGTDYNVSPSNILTLTPASGSTPLTIPAACNGNAGVTTITINGTITA